MKKLSNTFLFIFGLALSALSFAHEKNSNENLVVIDGSLTEIVYKLGAGDHIVAVDATSVYPKEATKLPNVGYLRALSAEGILSVKPQHIITTSAAGPKPVLDQLQQAGVKLTLIDTPFTIAGLKQKVSTLANLLDKKSEGTTLNADIEKKNQQLEAKLAQQKTTPKVLMFLSMQGNQLMAAGKGTQAQAVLDILNAENVATTSHGYKPMNKEAVLAANADVIILLSHQMGTEAEQKKAIAEQFSYTKAFKNNQVFMVDSSTLLGFGPRMPQALLDVAAKIYP